ELSRFAENFAESVGESIEATARDSVWKGATKHLEHMLSSAQRIEHSVETGTKWGGWRFRLRNQMARFGARQLEFPLEIRQDHIEILHGSPAGIRAGGLENYQSETESSSHIGRHPFRG